MPVPAIPSAALSLLRAYVVPLCVLLTLGACRSDESDDAAVAVSDSAGVRVVRNLRTAPETVVVTTPLTAIGHEDDDARYAFQYVQGLTPLRDGAVIVVDRAPRVGLFSPEGEWIRDIGREGAGPGEYRVPAWALVRGDTVTVYDMGQHRLVSLTLTGEPIGLQRLEPPGLAFRARPFSGGWIDKRERGQYSEPGPAEAFLVRRTASGALIDTLAGPYAVPQIGWRITDPATGSGVMENPPALSVEPPWTVMGGAWLAWTSGVDARIEVRDSTGSLVRLLELPLLPRDVTENDRSAHLAAMADRFGMDDDARERLRTSTLFARQMPLIARLLSSDRGRLWIGLYDAAVPLGGVGPRWQVLDEDGRLLRQVDFPPGFELHAVRGERAYGIRTDDLGVQVVEVYGVP